MAADPKRDFLFANTVGWKKVRSDKPGLGSTIVVALRRILTSHGIPSDTADKRSGHSGRRFFNSCASILGYSKSERACLGLWAQSREAGDPDLPAVYDDNRLISAHNIKLKCWEIVAEFCDNKQNIADFSWEMLYQHFHKIPSVGNLVISESDPSSNESA